MANDIFGGLGGLMKGFSSFMPQDDPNVKIMNAQNEVSELTAKETEIYAEIGKQVAKSQGLGAFPELADKLKLVQANLADAQSTLSTAKDEKDQSEAKAAEGKCPSCGHINPPNMKFCQECGAKLGALVCGKCGAKLEPGTRFCGECGSAV